MDKHGRRLALVVILLGIGFIIGDIISGAIGIASQAPTTPIVSAKLSGTFSATWTTATQTFVTGSVTFSPSFSVVPTMTITTRGINQQIPVSAGSTTFFAVETVGITWTNMPAAKTEIFGDTGQHQTIFNFAAISTASLCVTLLTGSNSATAILRPEYSLDGSTWFELAAISTTLDINIAGPLFLAGPICASGDNAEPVASAAKGQVQVWLRIVGINGGGVGDSPVFSIANMIMYTGFQFSPVCGENLAPSAIAFSWRCINVVAPGPFAPLSITVEWQAEVK